MTSQINLMRAYGVPQTFLSGQPYFDEVLTDFHAAALPVEHGRIYTIPARDAICPYCDMAVAGDVCRNCGARRKG